MDGTVKCSGSVADLADEPRHAERPWLSIAPRDHQPRRLAVSPRRCERSRCRRSRPTAAARCPTQRPGCGASRLVQSTRAGSRVDRAAWATFGPLDEGFVTLQGQRRSLWRAVDQESDVLSIASSSRVATVGRRHACSARCGRGRRVRRGGWSPTRCAATGLHLRPLPIPVARNALYVNRAVCIGLS